jgi:hypothetical protein
MTKSKFSRPAGLLLSAYCLLLAACCLPLAAATIIIDNKTYTLDTLAHFRVGPGTQYTELRLKSNSRLDVYFLKVDATNPFITFKAALGRDSIYTGEQPSALAKRKSKDGAVYFAGTNGDFYVTQGYVGYPIAGCMVENEIARIPTTARKIIAFDENKIPQIGVMSYNGTLKAGTETRTINTVNHLREENQLVLYNQHNGKITRTNAFGTELLVELLPGQSWGANKTIRGKVTKIEQNKGGMTIPKGMAVLSGHGTAATFLNTIALNDEVEITLNLVLDGQQGPYSEVIGGDNRNPMLKDGVVESNINQIWNELHPRTAVGYSQDRKTVIFCVVDGRGLSAGVTTKQLAELMLSAGAYTAFNMDGGGSSAMYVKEFGPMNVPSDGTERAVSNSLFAVSTAPADPVISAIESYETTLKLPPFGVFKPQFLGYNEYGMLLNKDLQGVTLSCEPTLGYINTDGQLVASGGSNGFLVARWNNTSCTIKVEIVQEAEIALRLDSVLIDNTRDYAIEVQSKIGLNTMTVLPAALNWTVADASICTIDKGVLRGLKNGRTWVIGNLGDFKDTLQVIVEAPETGRVIADNFSETNSWTLTSSLSSWNTTFTTENIPAAWNHGTGIRYTFKSTRSPFFKISRNLRFYSLPDTIKIAFNTGNVALSNLIVGVRTSTQTSSFPVSFTAIQANQETELSIPVAQFAGNTNDLSQYPVYLDYLTFYLNSSAHVVDETYQLNIKEIALIYKNLPTAINIPKISQRQLSLHPNPANGQAIAVVGTRNSNELITTRIYNTEGRMLGLKTFSAGSDSLQLSVEHLQPGQYFLYVSQGKTAETLPFIKN